MSWAGTFAKLIATMRILPFLYLLMVLPLAAQTNAELNKLFHDYYEWTLRQSPESATSAGRTEYNDRWSDYTPSALQHQKTDLEAFLKRNDAFRDAQLSEGDRLSVDLLQYEVAEGILSSQREQIIELNACAGAVFDEVVVHDSGIEDIHSGRY